MEKTKFNEMSDEKLLRQRKSIQLVTGLLAGMLTMLLIMVVFLAVKKGVNATSIALGVIPFALLPIVFLNFNTLKEIQKELNFRKIAN
ncbi:redox-active disulfide protein 2 [uncultured Fibrella sp.]|uniref:redox-active disulfide protein 2 n=1 Tax=uncultured Fibrella sp. TaxID=1284596 RepID=UPI0035CBC468